eukprot:1801031-Amphidinium_carterae.4
MSRHSCCHALRRESESSAPTEFHFAVVAMRSEGSSTLSTTIVSHRVTSVLALWLPSPLNLSRAESVTPPSKKQEFVCMPLSLPPSERATPPWPRGAPDYVLNNR